MEPKENFGIKIKTAVALLKKHWKTPPDGYYVNYKEFLNMALGSGSMSFFSVIISWTTIAINIPMMISYFKVSTGFVFIAGIVGSLFGLVRAPILSMMIDNSNSKKGKFKPFLPWTSVLTVICFTFIPFIPEVWVDNILFGFNIPSIPVFAVAASHIDVSLGSLLMFLFITARKNELLFIRNLLQRLNSAKGQSICLQISIFGLLQYLILLWVFAEILICTFGFVIMP